MNLFEVVDQVRSFLERHGRVSHRMLRRQFDLDEEALEELIEELVDVQRMAVREENALAWTGAATPAAPAGPERDPRAYTPKHLADKILQSKSALEGERKQVTVLFADVKGSTELAEQVDPEEWHAILDRFFQILSDGVHRFEGTVNQYTGDGIMALFGAPIAHEDHAQRACYASLHLRDELRRYADEVRLARGLNFSVRMGLNSGEVVVGKIGDDLRMDYTAQGQVVNLAQRMEQLAESGRVYLTQDTADRVAGYFRLREVGPTRVSGVRDPVRVHDLEDVGEFQSRFEVSRARGLSKFVGREREMAVLEEALERAAAGNAPIVGIVAEAGTGKSRLAFEFAERCRARGLEVGTSSCPPHGKAIPMGLVMSMQRSLTGISERDTAEAARNKIAARLSRRDPSLVEFIPFLMDFLGVAEPRQSGGFQDPAARQQEFLRYVKRMIELPRSQVLVTVFEDLHWVDSASQAVTLEVARIQQSKLYLTVKTFRPEYRPPEADWPDYEEIRLRPLTADSIAELLRDLLGPEASGRGLEPLIQERAAGNPFFVEEIVQSLAESEHLVGTRGAYRLARAVAEIEVPDSVQAVLAARIDRLDESAKQILRSAAVIGNAFPQSLLEGVTGMPVRELEAILHDLAHAEFVYQEAAYPEVEYAFKHPLTRQVAYESQLRERRRRVHGEVARRLEERHRETLDEKAALLAHHLAAAGQPLDAARWHRRAAPWILIRHPSEAVGHWRAVRTLLADVPESPETIALGLEAREQLLSLGVRAGQLTEEADRLFEEGLELAERSGDPRARIAILSGYGTHQLWGKPLPVAIRTLREAESTARELGEPALGFAPRLWRVLAQLYAGPLSETLTLSDELLADLAEDPSLGRASLGYPVEIGIHSWRSLLLALLGRMADAQSEAKRVLGLAGASGEPLLLAISGIYACAVASQRGDVQAAIEIGQRAVEQAERNGAPAAVSGSHCWLAAAFTDAGRWEAARDAAQTAIELGVPLYGTIARPVLARAWLGLDEIDRARDAAHAALDYAQAFGYRHREAESLLVLARVGMRAAGPPAQDEIQAQLDRARDVATEMDARSLQPHVLEARAELAAVLRDEAARLNHLREAHHLYTEMGATGHAERLARELAAAAE